MLMKNKIDYNKVIATLFFIIPIVIIIYCFSSGISGNDFWWHVKVGEYVLDNGAVPTTDIFSWYGTELSIEWTAHEWLADVVYYLIHNTLGQIGIFLFSVGSAVALYWCLWRESRKHHSQNILFRR